MTMGDRPSVDRRRFPRRPLALAVEFLHAPSERRFPARSVDISRGGMLLYVPVGAPIAPGHRVRLLMKVSPDSPPAGDVPDGPIEATVVRVARGRIPDIGYLPVGVQFDAPGQ